MCQQLVWASAAIAPMCVCVHRALFTNRIRRQSLRPRATHHRNWFLRLPDDDYTRTELLMTDYWINVLFSSIQQITLPDMEKWANRLPGKNSGKYYQLSNTVTTEASYIAIWR